VSPLRWSVVVFTSIGTAFSAFTNGTGQGSPTSGKRIAFGLPVGIARPASVYFHSTKYVLNSSLPLGVPTPV
jgi:hypothetical protein